MPEDQNYWSEVWNSRLNNFLINVLGWKQHGPSNVDIRCETVVRREVGIDSVFTYKRNPQSAQQVIVVEAKFTENLKNVNRSKVQAWSDTLLEKLSCLPYSAHFHEVYQPERTAQFHRGLVGLCVQNAASYDHARLKSWLADIQPPNRRKPIVLTFISNQVIARWCAAHQKLEKLRSTGDYSRVRYVFPDYGPLPHADGSCVPIESLLSKIIFIRATRRKPLKGKPSFDEFETASVIYLGQADTVEEWRFLALAIKQFQLLDMGEVEVCTIQDPAAVRGPIDHFRSQLQAGSVDFQFTKLETSDEIPQWLE
jgi:hypothetical protein